MDKLALPALAKLTKCIAAHQAFQSASSLSPLLIRVVTLAGQCCSLAVWEIHDVAAILPLTSALTDLAHVLTEAVVDRAERFRPLDSVAISRAHQDFSSYQAEVKRALLGTRATISLSEGGHGVVAADANAPALAQGQRPLRQLAPAPGQAQQLWRSEVLRQLWEARCVPKYDGPAPLDDLAVILLRAAGFEATIAHREAIMRRLSSLSLKDPDRVSAVELDVCGPELRRCGSLRAWIHALLESGGAQVVRPAASATGSKPLSSTWGSAPATCGASFKSTGGSSMPLSARTTGAFSSRLQENRRTFALAGRRAAGGTGTEDASALHAAVERSLLKVSQRLVLGERVDVDARSGAFGETALHVAAAQDCRHAPLASLLLQRGADANAEDRHLQTPLHVAAATGRCAFAAKLVACGANVSKEDRWNATPLHKASASGQQEVVDLLLRHGGDAAAADAWGATPLHRAAARGHLFVAEQLIGSGAVDVNAEDAHGHRPLHLAAGAGNYALVKLLLEHGGSAGVGARSRLAGRTPEDCARIRGHCDVVTLLQHQDQWISTRSQALMTA